MPYKDPKQNREYQRLWAAQRRADWFANKYCVVCGSQNDLQIDHIDPSTKDPRLKTRTKAGNLWSWSKSNQEIELAKCQVLCREHHDEKTKKDLACDHGGPTMWKKHKCRCELCCAWKKTVDKNLVKIKPTGS